MVREPDQREAQAEAEARPAPVAAPAPPTVTPEVSSPASLLALQRSAGNQAVTQMLGGQTLARETETAVDKAPAQAALLGLERTTVDFSRGKRRWLSANWIEYIRYTSGNPRLSWTGDIVDGTVSNALGNAVAEGAMFIGKRAIGRGTGAAAAAAAGAAIGSVPGAIIGFVIGVLIETAVGLIYDSIKGSSEERAASEASRRTGALIENREAALQREEAAGIEAGRRQVDQVRREIDAATDQHTVDGIRQNAIDQDREMANNIPHEASMSLANEMLDDWVLEHAGDEEDADTETSEPEWEAARDRQFGGDLDNKPELFAYQTRHHFSRIGAPIAPAQAAVEQAKTWAGLGDDWMLGEWDSHRFTITSAADPDAMIAFLGSHYASLTELGQQHIRDGNFTLECVLDLTSADGSVYVDEWEYTLTFPGEGHFWVRTSPPHARRNPLHFTVSPD